MLSPPLWVKFISTPPVLIKMDCTPIKIWAPPSGCFWHLPLWLYCLISTTIVQSFQNSIPELFCTQLPSSVDLILIYLHLAQLLLFLPISTSCKVNFDCFLSFHSNRYNINININKLNSQFCGWNLCLARLLVCRLNCRSGVSIHGLWVWVTWSISSLREMGLSHLFVCSAECPRSVENMLRLVTNMCARQTVADYLLELAFMSVLN